MRKTAASLLLAASSLCAGMAGAQGTAQVSMTDFSWALVDLDPNDGIDPSLSFLAPDPARPSSAVATVAGSGGWVSDVRSGGAAFAPVSVSAANALGSTSGTMSGAPGAGFSLSASAVLNGGDSVLSNSLSTGYLGFVLSPMTAVTFTSRAVIDLALDVPPGPLAGGYTAASVRLDATTDLGVFPENWNDSAVLSTSGGPQSLDRMLSLTLANVMGTVSTNELQFSSAIDAELTSPVPEPGTWTMFAGGLALLFAHARLRKQARARR